MKIRLAVLWLYAGRQADMTKHRLVFITFEHERAKNGFLNITMRNKFCDSSLCIVRQCCTLETTQKALYLAIAKRFLPAGNLFNTGLFDGLWESLARAQ